MSELTPGLDERIRSVQESLRSAELSCGRASGSVRLLAVSKTFPFSAVEEAFKLGMREFAENYVQEGVDKIEAFRAQYPQEKVTWHFIGNLQSNKTRTVAEHFDWVQTVDRLRIARRLSDQRPAHLAPLNILIEVNVSGELSKGGAEPADVFALASAVSVLPNLKLRGLMAIPAPGASPEEKKAPLLEMAALFKSLQARGFDIDTLSMGMSADMAEAVECGSTMVRVGSAIFGPRDYSAAPRS